MRQFVNGPKNLLSRYLSFYLLPLATLALELLAVVNQRERGGNWMAGVEYKKGKVILCRARSYYPLFTPLQTLTRHVLVKQKRGTF